MNTYKMRTKEITELDLKKLTKDGLPNLAKLIRKIFKTNLA